MRKKPSCVHVFCARAFGYLQDMVKNVFQKNYTVPVIVSVAEPGTIEMAPVVASCV